MKALLVGINAKYIHPCLAIYQLKKNTSYDVDILEFTIKEPNSTIIDTILNHINQEKINIIGFSSYLWNIEKILDISFFIKQNFPNIKIMLGGPEVGFDARYYLTKYHQIDYIISNDGENSFHELLEFLDNLRPIKMVSNLRYLDQGTYIENEIKLPDLSKIKLATLDVNDLKNRIVYLESGRGCPYKCSYCTASLDNKVRFFPLDDVINIVKILMEKEVKTVKFLDRTFNANMKYMIDILDFIDKNNKCTTFQFEIVVEKFNDEAIKKVASLKSKFLRFEIGIQSTNDIVNESVCRKQNMELLEKNLKLLQETNKVDLHVDLIAGLPYETKDMFINSFNRVFSYKAKELQLGFLKFLRGTKMLDYVDEHEYQYDDLPPYEIIKNKYMSISDLQEIHVVEDMLETYYNSSKFKKTFDYLIDNNIIDNYYLFFKELHTNYNKGQLHVIFSHIDNFFKDYYNDYYDILHLLLIEDYLDIHKTKPKIWWEYNITKQDRKSLYEEIVSSTNINIEDLYRYSIVYKNNKLNKTYIAIYKNFKVETTLI